MSYIFGTLIVPAANGPKAVAITNALGIPHAGMFKVKVDDTGSTIGYISTGSILTDSPVIKDAAALWTAVQAGTPGAVTLADCQSFVASLDKTQINPYSRQAQIKTEVKTAATAPAWVQPTGAHDAYPVDYVVMYGGKGWVNLTPANVWQPGVTGWRESWGTVTAGGYPAWVQPLGAQDAYAMGAKVSHNGQNWNSEYAANVWEPGVFGWTVI